MTHSRSVIVEFYAMIHNADKSFQKLNRIIRKYNYEIVRYTLPDFEKKFRHLFNLEAYNENKHQQNAVVACNNTKGERVSFSVTEEFYQLLVAYYTNDNSFFQTGCISLLKTKKIFHKSSESEYLDMGIVIQDLERLKKFTIQLESCLRFVRYGNIAFHFHFAEISDEGRLIPLMDIGRNDTQIKINEFVERDNHLISALLNIDHPIAGYIQFAILSFEESFRIQDNTVRFIHLLNTLEMCFHSSSSDSGTQVVARYSSLLVAINKREFYSLYTQLINLFAFRKKILSGEIRNEDTVEETEPLAHKVSFIEELSRNVMKKLVYLNIKTQEELFYKLDLKTLPGQFSNDLHFY